VKLANGQALRTFEELMAVETDDCITWPHAILRNGYGKMTMDGRFTYVHRRALQIVSGIEGQGLEARHGPGCPRSCMNARAGHVTWGTNQENSIDRHRDGTCVQAKLTPEQVHEIRRLVDGKLERQKDIASRFGVSTDLIYKIKYRRIWRHLPERGNEHGK
jgi:hypothetical protein